MHVGHNPDHFERNYVGGDWVFSREGYGFDIYDPSNSEVIAAVPLSSRFDVAEAVASASASHTNWAARPRSERIAIIADAVTLIERDLKEIVELEARDTGTPRRFLSEQITRAAKDVKTRLFREETAQEVQPAGIVGAILSWSGPFVLSCREMLPALSAGHTMVVKPSMKAPLSSVFLAEILHEAGLPSGVFNIVQGTGLDVGASLAGQNGLSQVWFQGSRQTAKAVARAARTIGAELRVCLRRPNLTVVDSDADFEIAADHIMSAGLLGTGLAGFGGQVVHAHGDAYRPLIARLERRIDEVRYGSPAELDTDVGPMISEAFRVARQAALDQLEAHGATTMCQARAPDRQMERMGWFVRPCILLIFKYDQLLNAEIPLGPTIITRSLPSKSLRDGLRESDWNSCSIFEARKMTTNALYGAVFSRA
jgi:acyl-CoA reductase-like NAD-dependent aldehyde dehydrogenase